jgi:ribokinase
VEHLLNDVIVLGSINMDIVGTVARMPRPGETVFGESLAYLPGGKGANQAVAAARAGASTRLIGRVGNDPFAGALLEFLRKENIDLQHVGTSANLPSGIAIIPIDAEGENTVTVFSGSNAAVLPPDVAACDIPLGAVAVTQFEVPQETVHAFFKKAKTAGARTVLNTAPAVKCNMDIFTLADIIIMNETECGFYTGQDTVVDPEAARGLLTSDAQRVILTLGAAGLIIVGRSIHIPIAGHKVRTLDTTGAGDCFTGNLAAAIASGLDITAAAETANAAAALSVQRLGAGPAMPLARETKQFLEKTTS